MWAPVMGLPWLLGVREKSQLMGAPWIHAEAVRPRDDASSRPRVGINWAGNRPCVRLRALDVARDVRSTDRGPPRGRWVSLHRGTCAGRTAETGLPQPLAQAADFLDTARAIAGLDLVLSTETAIPNLSGAMGVPTGVLCVRDWDWRWDGWFPDVTVCAGARATGPRCSRRRRRSSSAPSRRHAPPDGKAPAFSAGDAPGEPPSRAAATAQNRPTPKSPAIATTCQPMPNSPCSGPESEVPREQQRRAVEQQPAAAVGIVRRHSASIGAQSTAAMGMNLGANAANAPCCHTRMVGHTGLRQVQQDAAGGVR